MPHDTDRLPSPSGGRGFDPLALVAGGVVAFALIYLAWHIAGWLA